MNLFGLRESEYSVYLAVSSNMIVLLLISEYQCPGKHTHWQTEVSVVECWNWFPESTNGAWNIFILAGGTKLVPLKMKTPQLTPLASFFNTFLSISLYLPLLLLLSSSGARVWRCARWSFPAVCWYMAPSASLRTKPKRRQLCLPCSAWLAQSFYTMKNTNSLSAYSDSNWTVPCLECHSLMLSDAIT